jgi:cyanophycinase
MDLYQPEDSNVLVPPSIAACGKVSPVRCRPLWAFVVAYAIVACLCLELRGADGVVPRPQTEGKLVICGGGTLPDSIRHEFLRGLRDDSTVVILATASSDVAAAASRAANWLSTAATLTVRTPELTAEGVVRDADQLLSIVSQSIADADAVWMTGGQQSRLATRYAGTTVEQEVLRLLERGGTVGGTSAGAAIMSRVMIQSGRQQPKIGTGFDLLKRAIIDQHFSQRGRIARSRIAVRNHPDRFGVGIDESTAAVIQGTSLNVLGTGTVTLLRVTPSAQNLTESIVRNGEVVDLTFIPTATPPIRP